MKGDAIGNTLYSERWVLKALMKLTQLEKQEINDEFESELCLLWDMTIEKDVVNFMMKHDFLSIATKVIQSSENMRIIEIIVGVIGNMCCVESVRGELSQRKETVETLLALLETPDSCVLVQLVRLLHSTAWDLVHNPDYGPHWLENEFNNTRLSSHIAFILMSSTNEELLFCVLELLATTCSLNINDKDFSLYFSTPEIVKGLIESWQQLFANWTLEDDFPSKHHTKAATHWTEVLCSFTGHVSGRTVLCQFGEQLGDIFSKIICRPPDCLDKLLVSTVTLMEAIIRVYFNENSFKKVLHILHNLYQIVVRRFTGEPTNNEDNLEPILQESIETYCANVSSIIDHHILNATLAECNENHVLLYWKIVNDRQIDVDLGERAI
ncbi:hypothetical protein AAG570_010975 [Ranatra chinensis]|uniref:Protein saal1 n=1 Tax=Ranatra chinensis TaxID=642074 RepID=A0ABD0YJF9_9HEMI